MIFQDNVIKEYLKNVYFITGTPCGGKTTISRTLAKTSDLSTNGVTEWITITETRLHIYK